MHSTLISIVIPIYNGEKYITRCINSILKQTYKNFEIICVNDGSTDNSLNILEALKTKDSRIKIINKENGGAFQARKTGVINARGEFLLFCDADDTFTNNDSIKILCNYLAEDPSLQLIQFSSKSTYPSGISVSLTKDLFTGKLNIDDFKSKYGHEVMSSQPKTTISPVLWNKMYKTDILRSVLINITDLSIPVGEDLYLNLLYLDSPDVKNILFTDDVFYNYYLGIGVMSTGNQWKAITGYEELKKLQLELIDKWNLDKSTIYYCHLETIYYRLTIVKQEIYNKTPDDTIINNLKKTSLMSHFTTAKEYFLNNPDSMFPELDILLNASPEEYLKYTKETYKKPSAVKKIMNKAKSFTSKIFKK